MARTAASYTLDNTWEKAHRRLTMLESLYDRATIDRLLTLGVQPGWRCLELGAGAGSIARWLCDRIGPTGVVTAVDLEPRFLEADPRPNLEIYRCDVVADGIPGDGYDLIHTRALLVHLTGREELIARLVSLLRPGGLILLEEPDFYPCQTAESPLYSQMWDRCCSAAAKMGGDWYWGRHLPARLAAAGSAEVGAVTETQMFNGGTLWAEFFAMTWEQLEPLLLNEGAAAALIGAATKELSDTNRWFPGCAMVTAWGRRPPWQAAEALPDRQ
jgi:2-polyprenyl-3-methyl-5-hydroxy-6-metoxy-1,4-benzoquinol methylase